MDLHELSCFLERVSANPDAPLEGADSALLEQACAEFPYSGALQLLRLRHALVAGGDGCLDELKMRVALMSSDARTLAYAGHGSDWSALCPEPASEHEMPTEDVIDTFLRTYGNCSAEEEALLERMIFNPTPDYAEMLAREEQENLPEVPPETDSQDARIAAFILSQH
ncbi:MAG: hypothetical protein K2F79_02235, partial [Muribaculaceae bacterium]|nr:hypothetical protein [Muribaculaceae bacterium]